MIWDGASRTSSLGKSQSGELLFSIRHTGAASSPTVVDKTFVLIKGLESLLRCKLAHSKMILDMPHIVR